MKLILNDDFSAEKIANSGQCFRWDKIRETVWRIISGERCVYLKQTGEQELELYGKAEDLDYWKNYFDLQTDYQSIRKKIHKARDPFLYAAAEHQKGIRILRQELWEMLITFIISQNRNIPAIKKSVELLSETCGNKHADIRGVEYYGFPYPEAIAALGEEDLKACKLGYRSTYIQKAAAAVCDGSLNLEALKGEEEESAREQLLRLTGVGNKVANCISLFGLHHVNAFPIDVWIRRILEEYYPGGYPYELYTPYNGIYQQYMFAYYRYLHAEQRKQKE